ncbi:thioredoxin [Tumebacillus algifaecis]|uniref:Thioredoxin n=1 Tax=Tumebacillus algifaecis TaxID=1214604 RepID=A0A223CZE3_9BACL|nr:thioredoxin [Tumebacillus algifaecis]ASS74711.1 thioredoxin [Tumebacillus algifaecis]
MASDAILTITDANFAETIKNSETPILVDFWATWCGPCRMLAPVLEDVSTETAGKLSIGKLNIDENQATTQQFGVMSIPTMLVFKGGEVVKTIVGYKSKNDLLNELESVI